MKKDAVLILVIFFVVAAVFILDLLTPRGMADATAYILPVLLCLWSPRKYLTHIVTAACLSLTLAGFYLSPPGGELWRIIYNRGLSALAIVVTAVLSMRKNAEYQETLRQSRLTGLLKNENISPKALETANSQIQMFSKDLEGKKRELENAYLHTLNSLSFAAEFKDEETGHHILRISRYSEILATTLGLPPGQVKSIALASAMHDIGKVGIPDRILQKPGKLTAEEFEIIKQHSIIGMGILGFIEAPIVNLAREIALSHHERWDGSGYPNGLSGADIPLSARIVGLVDCFDALTSPRVYKKPYPVETACDLIVRERGKSFDPEVVDAFIRCADQYKAVVLQHGSLAQSVVLSERDLAQPSS